MFTLSQNGHNKGMACLVYDKGEHMSRHYNYSIMDPIKNRWSPRAFDSTPIALDDLHALIEAARYAPSCFNEQPWRFIIAHEQEQLKKMQSVLNPTNQEWANQAPVLILIVANRFFSSSGKDNYWHMFDAGTAWGYLSLEATQRGLITHAMGGFKRDLARELFNISEDYDIITVVAVGRYGDPSTLSEAQQAREKPNVRKPLEELLLP